MPEQDKQKRPLEYIRSWRNKIKNKYEPVRTVTKKLLSGDKPSLEEYGDVFDLLPEKMQRRALNVALHVIPAPNPTTVVSSYLNSGKSNIKKDIRYISSGIGKPSVDDYSGLFARNKEVPKPDIIDAITLNKKVNPKIGVPVKDDDYGILSNYKNRVYPNINPQFIETVPPGARSQKGIKSLGVVPVGLDGSFITSDPDIRIDNAGYSLEHGTRNDSTFVRAWDIYDFKSNGNKNGYNSKWLYGDNKAQDLINKMDKLIHPLFIRTPWVYYKDTDKIVEGGIYLDERFDK